MTVTASIDFRVYLCTISLIDILSILSSHGWNFSDSGHQVYLPINDNDEWNWKSEKLNNEELFDIFHNITLVHNHQVCFVDNKL